MVQVKNIENHWNTDGKFIITCKGELVLMECAREDALLFFSEVLGFSIYNKSLPIKSEGTYLKPIIISESEEIKIGDTFYVFLSDNIEVMQDVDYGEFNPNELFDKVLCFPENFSIETLQKIADGEILAGTDVKIECTKWCESCKRENPIGNHSCKSPICDGEIKNVIKLNNNYINIL